MLTACLAMAAGVGETWFGPIEVKVPAQSWVQPYDEQKGDVWAEFVQGDHTERRPAFFDGKDFVVRALLPTGGDYRARMVYAGHPLGDWKKVFAAPTPAEFVRLGGPWGFRFSSGRLYWPMGHNLAWQNGGEPALADSLRAMKGYGANWSRVWACHWDGKNVFWKPDAMDFDQAAAAKWDDVIRGAEDGSVKLQFVLFHHGPWSTTVNSNWKENPLNAANGGWLKQPEEFFTDSRAKRLARSWIRYAVARWGASPSVMAWELFNEVEWADGIAKDKEAVGRWHREMAAYIRSIDPYHHLVTTSAHEDLPIYSAMDYRQPHGYPASVRQMVAAYELPKGQPAFFGEIGPASHAEDGTDEHTAVRDGLYTALFDRHAGAGQYWYWDLVAKHHLQAEWTTAAKELEVLKPFTRAGWKRLPIGVASSSRGDLVLVPGAGWAAFRKYDYSLPGDSGALGGFSSYFQGQGHREMRERPVTMRFANPEPSRLSIRVGEVSSAGGNLKVTVNGRVSAGKDFPPGSKPSELTVPLPAGACVVSIENDGPDWVKIDSITVPNIGLPVEADGAGDGSVALVRCVATRLHGEFRLTQLGLPDGTYRLTVTDLDRHTTRTQSVSVSSGRTSLLSTSAKDALYRFESEKRS